MASAPAIAASTSGSGVGTVTEYSVPFGDSSQPDLSGGVTLGPDGNVWFTERTVNCFNGTFTCEGIVDRIAPDGTLTQFPSPAPYPNGITTGPDGNLWVAGSGSVGRMKTDGTVLNVYTVNTGGDGITTGPDGDIWVSGGPITRITPSGDMTEFPIDGYALGITKGADGNLWYTNPVDFYQLGRIGRITPSGTITEFPVPLSPTYSATEPWSITNGPDGNLWFTDGFDQIGKVTTSGQFTMFNLPSPTGTPTIPTGITVGPDGNLWFTVHQLGRVVRMTPQGVRTGFALPAPYAGPTGITAGAKNTLWVEESGANGIPVNRIASLKVCGGSNCSLPSATK
jgi:virginiamycin B lyase